LYRTYLLRLEQKYIIYITKFRPSNIRIPIETKCSKDVIGDEYHYLFICNNTEIQRLRSKYIPKYYVQISSVAKIAGIFSLYNAQFWKTSIIFERNQ
jgi:hypothetical protein